MGRVASATLIITFITSMSSVYCSYNSAYNSGEHWFFATFDTRVYTCFFVIILMTHICTYVCASGAVFGTRAIAAAAGCAKTILLLLLLLLSL